MNRNTEPFDGYIIPMVTNGNRWLRANGLGDKYEVRPGRNKDFKFAVYDIKTGKLVRSGNDMTELNVFVANKEYCDTLSFSKFIRHYVQINVETRYPTSRIYVEGQVVKPGVREYSFRDKTDNRLFHRIRVDRNGLKDVFGDELDDWDVVEECMNNIVKNEKEIYFPFCTSFGEMNTLIARCGLDKIVKFMWKIEKTPNGKAKPSEKKTLILAACIKDQVVQITDFEGESLYDFYNYIDRSDKPFEIYRMFFVNQAELAKYCMNKLNSGKTLKTYKNGHQIYYKAIC